MVGARCLWAGRTSPEWTSRDSNHHHQSVSAGKSNTIPTEPSGRLCEEFLKARISWLAASRSAKTAVWKSGNAAV